MASPAFDPKLELLQPVAPRQVEVSNGVRIRTGFGVFVAILLDCFLIVAGTSAGLLCYELIRNHPFHVSALRVLAFSTQYALIFLVLACAHYLYDYSHSLLRVRDTAAVLRVSVVALMVYAVGLFFSKFVFPRLLLVLCWMFITMLLVAQKHFLRKFVTQWKTGRATQRRVLIYGVGSEARRLYSYLLNSPHLGLNPVAFVNQAKKFDQTVIYSHDYRFRHNAPVFKRQISCDLLEELNIHEIFVADSSSSDHQINELLTIAEHGAVPISFVGAVQPAFRNRHNSVRNMDGLWVTSFTSEGHESWIYRGAKRVLDVVVAGSAIVVSFPIWIAIAIAVKTSSSGPILFRQERAGLHGKPFYMLKFRSMYVDAPMYARSPEDPNDPRITKPGRWLRKTSLDELPQLLNVLMGHMSMVGPRPEMPNIVSRYTKTQWERLKVPQGITGLWQLSADRKFAIHESIEYDLYYIDNRGFFLDLAILLHTLVFAMKGI